MTITTRLKRYLFILSAAYIILIGGTYYYQIFAVRVFHHLFVTILLGFWLIRRLLHRRGLPPTPLNALLYLNVMVWFIAALFSLDPRMALENLWFPLTNLLLFFVMVDLLQTGWEALLIDTQFLLTTLVVLLSGIQLGSWFFGWGFGTPPGASVTGGGLPMSAVPLRLFIPFGVTTWLAAYTASLAVFTGAWAFAARRHGTRTAYWMLAVLLVLLMVLTGSRGGWLSLIAGAAIFLVLHLAGDLRFRIFVRRYRIPLLAIAAAAAAIFVFALMRLSADRAHSAGDILRFDLWRAAAAITVDHPLLGVGPGLFGRAFQLYRDPFNVDNRLSTAHNFYLNTLAETGVIGAGVAVGLAAILLLTWWRLWRHSETPSRKTHLEGALAALTGFGVQSFFDTFTLAPFVLLALLLTAYCVTATRSRLETRLKGNVPAALVSLVIVLASGFGILRSDQAQAAFNTSVHDQSFDQAQSAAALDPALNLYQLQIAYLTDGDSAQAIISYQQALTLEPTWDTGWINLAALYERQGDTTQALDALQHAIAIDNRNGALLLWAQLAERANLAPKSSIAEAYTKYLDLLELGKLPLSSFWEQTNLRKQTVEAYAQRLSLDLRYRITETHESEQLEALVPAAPETAAEWWVTGEYALSQGDAQKAEAAFTEAINRLTNSTYRGDYYASRARARLMLDPAGAARDLAAADLLGTYNESPNAVRAQLAHTLDEQRRLWKDAVPPQVIDQNFEGVLFAGRVASFNLLPEAHLPGPGHSVMQPWYDLAASYQATDQTEEAAKVYRAILDRAPEEQEAQMQLDRLAERDS